jgi:GrpB-like predicted nucleotidyltransferase (UPF0157 family)
MIHEYDPAWRHAFESERQRIGAHLDSRVTAIEHIGSTSVRGLAAKPLIDLMLAVRHDCFQECIDELHELGYRREPSGDFPGRVFLRRLDAQGNPTHHLSLTELESPYWLDQLAFRNALRADDALAAEYAELKRTLAARHGRSPTYTRAKTDFIRRALISVRHQPRSGWASGEPRRGTGGSTDGN